MRKKNYENKFADSYVILLVYSSCFKFYWKNKTNNERLDLIFILSSTAQFRSHRESNLPFIS